MAAAEDDEQIDRNPVRITKASNAPVMREQQPAPIDKIAAIVETMPDRLHLFIVLAAFVGLREGELFELRRSDIDPSTGTVAVTRKIEKDADPNAVGACPECGRVIGPPKTKSGNPPGASAAGVPAAAATPICSPTPPPGADGLLFPR
jgi:integrase